MKAARETSLSNSLEQEAEVKPLDKLTEADREEFHRALEVKLPVPPTANHLWKRKGNHFFRDPKYVAWLEDCSWILAEKRDVCFPGQVRITIAIYGGKGWRRNRDVDNVLKPVCDLLRHNEIIVDDSTKYVRDVRVYYRPPEMKRDRAWCVVNVEGL